MTQIGTPFSLCVKCFLIMAVMFLVGGCNMFRPDTRADLTRYEIFVEVDGKPYKITRTIQTWITYGFDTNQGSSQGKRSDYGTFGEKIHNNQAIVVSFAPSYNRRGKWKKDATEVQISEDAEYLKVAFKILLLDHYENPQVIEMYDSKEAFESAGARVKVLKTTRQNIPKIPFWPFQSDGKDRYYDYALTQVPSASQNADKYFETQSYSTQLVSDKSIERILKEFPELINNSELVKPDGTYHLEGRYELGLNGKYNVNDKKRYRGSRISALITQTSSCEEYPTKYDCHHYTGEKTNDGWVMLENKFPKKIYFSPNPRSYNSYYKKLTYEFKLNQQEVKFKKDPEYRNSTLNFLTKEYSRFGVGYYMTREHKK